MMYRSFTALFLFLLLVAITGCDDAGGASSARATKRGMWARLVPYWLTPIDEGHLAWGWGLDSTNRGSVIVDTRSGLPIARFPDLDGWVLEDVSPIVEGRALAIALGVKNGGRVARLFHLMVDVERALPGFELSNKVAGRPHPGLWVLGKKYVVDYAHRTDRRMDLYRVDPGSITRIAVPTVARLANDEGDRLWVITNDSLTSRLSMIDDQGRIIRDYTSLVSDSLSDNLMVGTDGRYAWVQSMNSRCYLIDSTLKSSTPLAPILPIPSEILAITSSGHAAWIRPLTSDSNGIYHYDVGMADSVRGEWLLPEMRIDAVFPIGDQKDAWVLGSLRDSLRMVLVKGESIVETSLRFEWDLPARAFPIARRSDAWLVGENIYLADTLARTIEVSEERFPYYQLDYTWPIDSGRGLVVWARNHQDHATAVLVDGSYILRKASDLPPVTLNIGSTHIVDTATSVMLDEVNPQGIPIDLHWPLVATAPGRRVEARLLQGARAIAVDTASIDSGDIVSLTMREREGEEIVAGRAYTLRLHFTDRWGSNVIVTFPEVEFVAPFFERPIVRTLLIYLGLLAVAMVLFNATKHRSSRAARWLPVLPLLAGALVSVAAEPAGIRGAIDWTTLATLSIATIPVLAAVSLHARRSA